MKWFSKFLPNLSKKSFSALAFNSGTYSTNNASPLVLSQEGYVLNSCVHSAVDLIIKAITQNELIVVSKNNDDNEPIENNLSKLLQMPDPDESQGQVDWLTEYFGYMLIFGNSLIYKVSPDAGLNVGRAQILKVMSQEQIKIITKQTAWGTILDRYEFTNGKGLLIDKDNVMHGKTFNPSNQVIGLSPLMSCGLNVDLINEVNRWNISLLQNGVNPSGIYSVEGELDEQSFRRIKAQMSENSGSKNAGAEKLLEGGMKYQQTGMNPKDTDFNVGIVNAKREVASVYNIAPQLIGDVAGSTFANYEQAILSLHNDVAYPLLNNLVTKLNNWLTPFFGEDLLIKIDNSKVGAIQEQNKREWAKIDTSVELTINEKRKAKGYEEIEGGDIIVINGVTLDNIVNPPPSMGGFGKSQKSRNKIDKKDYLSMQQKAITRNEDNAIQDSLEVIADYFENQLKEIEENFSGITDPINLNRAVEAVIQQTSPKLKEAYEIIYKDIAFEHSLKARKSYKQEIIDCIGMELKEANAYISNSFAILEKFKGEFGNYVDRYFDQIKLGDLIKNIDEETRLMVASAVEKGVKAGSGIPAITKDIKTLYGNDMAGWRAERIARTETLRGMSYAQHESQKLISPTSKQFWMSTNDARTRPSKSKGFFNHRVAEMANGSIGLTDAFKVSGENLSFPRDTSLGASAGNVINCRCTVGYIDEEFSEFFT